MPGQYFQEKVISGTAIVYGNEFLINDLPIDTPYTGAWHLSKNPQTERNFKVWNTPAVDQEDHEDQKTLSDWSENEDPFTQATLLENEEDQVQELIFQIRISTSIPNNERLANRLIVLFNDAKEEDSNNSGIAVGSLRNFYQFLQEYTNLKYPNITLTPDNNIYTSWEDEQDRLFSVHFLPNGDTRFVIFKPNDRHPERKIRLFGVTTTDTLIKTVESSGVWDWISE